MHTDCSFYLSQFIGPVINLMIVVVGWNILYKNAKKIASRSESRGLLDKVVEKIRSLENEGKTYWLKNAGLADGEESKIYTIKMQHDIQVLEDYLYLVNKRNINIELSQELFKLRNSITYSSEKLPRTQDINRALDISIRASEICNKLEEAFFLKYEPS